MDDSGLGGNHVMFGRRVFISPCLGGLRGESRWRVKVAGDEGGML